MANAHTREWDCIFAVTRNRIRLGLYTRLSTMRLGRGRADRDTWLIGSVYVPNGGKDFAAKLRFLEAMALLCHRLPHPGSGPDLVRRHECHAHRSWTSIPKSASRIQSASDPMNGMLRACHRQWRNGGHRARAGSRQRPAFHVVASVAQHAPEKHRLAAGLHSGQPIACGTHRPLLGALSGRHQRSCSRRRGSNIALAFSAFSL